MVGVRWEDYGREMIDEPLEVPESVSFLKLSGACIFGDRAGGAEEVVVVANLCKSQGVFAFFVAFGVG